MKITRATLKTLRPGPKASWHFDDGLPGFGVKLQPSGAASFVAVFRIRGAPTKKTVTLGPISTLSPDEARERARLLLAAAREGRDLDRETKERARALATEKRALANRLTVRHAITAYLADLAGRDSTQTGRPLASASLEAARYRLSALAARHSDDFLADLDCVAIEALVAALPSKSRRNCFGAINRLLIWAKRADHVAAVVTEDLDRPPAPPARTVTPSPADVRTLLTTADRLLACGRWVQTQRDAVHLIFLTGQRRSEITELDWSDVDLERALWRQPASKNKARREHLLPLSERVVTLLRARFEAAGRPTHGRILPGVRKGQSMRANLADLAKTLRAETGITFRNHDARRALTSACAERGVDFAVLDSLLNHAASQTRGGLRSVYNRASLLRPMSRALEIWEDAIFAGTVIVSLRRPA